MLIFLPTGILLELVHGPMRCGSIFVLGTIMGALTHLAWQSGILIGASAGIYAVKVCQFFAKREQVMVMRFLVRVWPT